MAAAPVALIIGAGPNIGAAVAKAFEAKGYKIALAARKLDDGMKENGNLHIKVDLSEPEKVPSIFEKVKEKLGIPSVVVYNGKHSITLAVYSYPGACPFYASTTHLPFAVQTFGIS